MFNPRMAWLLVLVGCSASSPAVHGGAGASPGETADAVDVDALRSRLAVPPPGALVRPGGKLFPSAALQPAPQPRRFAAEGLDFGRGFKLVENQGSALKLAVQGGNLEIEVFVAREQLLPVLAEEVSQVFEDGSGFVACPGLRVGLLEGRLVAAAKGLSELPIQLPESKAALGFVEGECSSLPALPRESEIGCVAGEPLKTLESLGEFAHLRRCGVRDWAGELLPPTLNGAPVEPSIVPLVWSTTVHRHQDRLLISLWVPESKGAERARLQLRVVGRPSHVEDPSGMGTLGRGPARGPRVRSGAAVYFHDGTPAGRYVGSGITLEDEPAGSSPAAAGDDSGKVCVIAPVEGGLCFARADLEAAEVRAHVDAVRGARRSDALPGPPHREHLVHTERRALRARGEQAAEDPAQRVRLAQRDLASLVGEPRLVLPDHERARRVGDGPLPTYVRALCAGAYESVQEARLEREEAGYGAELRYVLALAREEADHR